MISYPTSLIGVGGARTGIAPANLLDIEDINGNLSYWADRPIKAPAALGPSIFSSPYKAAAVGNRTTPTSTVTLAVTQGDLLLLLVYADCYGVQAPVAPTISADSQGNVWTTDKTNFAFYIGGTGFGFLLAHAVAGATGNLTVTTSVPAGCYTGALLVSTNATSVDSTALLGASIGGGNLALSASASGADEYALVLALGKSDATATPGTQLFSFGNISTTRQGMIWDFVAAPGTNDCTVDERTYNFPVAAMVILNGTVVNVTDPQYAALAGPQQYSARLLSVPQFTFHRSLTTDIGTFVVENLSGDTVSRDTEKQLRRSAIEGSMFVWRLWQADAQAAWLEVHGTLTVEEIAISTLKLRGAQLMNPAPADGSIECFAEGCQLTWAKARCGSTQPTECTYSVQTCQVIERIMAFPNSFEKNYGETLANISEKNQNRQRRI